MTMMEELLSYIRGPVIKGRPVYTLRSCLECLTDEQLCLMMEAYNLSCCNSDTDRPSLIGSLFDTIITTDTISTILTAEELAPGHSSFMIRTIDAMRLADGLWSQPAAGEEKLELEQLKRELHDLEMATHTYYPQYEGQFDSDAEYEADRKRHYAEIDREVVACRNRIQEYMATAGMEGNLETTIEGSVRMNGSVGNPKTSKVWRGWPTSLVLNSKPDAHLSLLQQLGLVYIFTDWDGKGRESGYRCALDIVVNWSEVVKRDREDLDSNVYNLGRARFTGHGLFGSSREQVIGAMPFKARQKVKNGEKVWTTEAPRGREPKIDDDVCLRLVVPVEIQKVVWERFLENISK